MSAATLAEKLRGQGFDPAELAHATVLCEDVLGTFTHTAGGDPEHVWWVPGRVEVFGKHTDYVGGRSLVAPVPRGFVIAARRSTGRRIRLQDARRREGLEIDLDAVDTEYSGWRHYVEVVVRRFSRNFPGVRSGADVAFASNLPRASGLSSSSALVVGIAAALVELWNVPSNPEWRANIRSPLDRAGYFASLENGRTFGTLRGDAGVGTRGGSEDHAAIICGRAGHLSCYAFVPPRHVEDIPQPGGWRFAIASSGVTAEKTGAARQAYNRLAEAIRVLLECWNATGSPRASLADALQSRPDAFERLTRLLRDRREDGWDREALERRLTHFVREDARVVEAASAFRRADVDAVGRLARASQADAESLLGNQVPETSALAALAVDLGAAGACSFGAGFGGSVWALVPASSAAAFADKWLAAYRGRFAAGERAVVFTAAPSLPLTQVV